MYDRRGLGLNTETKPGYERTNEYRGYRIHTEVVATSTDLYLTKSTVIPNPFGSIFDRDTVRDIAMRCASKRHVKGTEPIIAEVTQRKYDLCLRVSSIAKYHRLLPGFNFYSMHSHNCVTRFVALLQLLSMPSSPRSTPYCIAMHLPKRPRRRSHLT